LFAVLAKAYERDIAELKRKAADDKNQIEELQRQVDNPAFMAAHQRAADLEVQIEQLKMSHTASDMLDMQQKFNKMTSTLKQRIDSSQSSRLQTAFDFFDINGDGELESDEFFEIGRRI
jgi:Ca2+-binding EF-hand superfamily protein